MLSLSKRNLKAITIYILYFLIIILLMNIFVNYINRSNQTAAIENSMNYELIEGVVYSKHQDNSWGKRGGLSLVVDGGKYSIENDEIFDLIKVGDTVKKNKGEKWFYINGIAHEY
jgi:hypothetical protein